MATLLCHLGPWGRLNHSIGIGVAFVDTLSDSASVCVYVCISNAAFKKPGLRPEIIMHIVFLIYLLLSNMDNSFAVKK